MPAVLPDNIIAEWTITAIEENQVVLNSGSPQHPLQSVMA